MTDNIVKYQIINSYLFYRLFLIDAQYYSNLFTILLSKISKFLYVLLRKACLRNYFFQLP